MERDRMRWIVVVDTRRARLLEVSRTAHGRVHVEERAALEEQWDEREHHRPSMLASKGRSFAQPAHELEERRRRFAREVARWVAKQLDEHRVEAAPLLCAASLLGELRTACPAALLARLEVRQCDVARLTPAQLADHPAIAEALA
jgi:protein required for attachment to host cells